MCEVGFRYILKSNIDVEIAGVVHIPEDEDAGDEGFEIEFMKAGDSPSWNLFVNHYGVGIRGRTDEQDYEIDQLKELFTSDDSFLTTICDFKDENRIFEEEKIYLVIGDVDFEQWLFDKNNASTTIRVKRITKARLQKIGSKGDTFDDIINILLDQYEN